MILYCVCLCVYRVGFWGGKKGGGFVDFDGKDQKVNGLIHN